MSAIASRAAAPTGGIGREMSLLADGVERFCADSVSLAKLEVAEGARSMAGNLAWIGLFAMVVGLGYGLLSLALALSLTASLGTVGAFVAVGSANALAGALGLKVVAGRLVAASAP
jgi:hypothetical protein